MVIIIKKNIINNLGIVKSIYTVGAFFMPKIKKIGGFYHGKNYVKWHET